MKKPKLPKAGKKYLLVMEVDIAGVNSFGNGWFTARTPDGSSLVIVPGDKAIKGLAKIDD